MKKILALLMTVVLVLTVFAACGAPTDSNNGDTIKLGGIGPTTGGAASYGNSVKNGMQLAIDEINAAGGVNGMKFEMLDFQDDEADGTKAKSAYATLMDKGMQILIGAVTSGASVALNDDVKKDGILQITPSASQKEAAENSNSFRICFTDPAQGTKMADYIFNTCKLTKVAMIYNQDDSYSTGIADAFRAEFTKLGGKISVETPFAKDASDFNAQITQVKGSDAEGIFMPIYNDKAAQIALAANDKGLKLPMFGCDGWDGIIEKYLNGEGQAALVEGAIYLTPFISTAEDENVQKFVKAYTEKFGAAPDQFAADAYDAVYVAKAAVEKAGIQSASEIGAGKTEGNAKLIKAMTEIEVAGTTGTMKFTADGEPDKQARVAKIEAGKYVAQ